MQTLDVHIENNKMRGNKVNFFINHTHIYFITIMKTESYDIFFKVLNLKFMSPIGIYIRYL